MRRGIQLNGILPAPGHTPPCDRENPGSRFIPPSGKEPLIFGVHGLHCESPHPSCAHQAFPQPAIDPARHDEQPRGTSAHQCPHRFGTMTEGGEEKAQRFTMALSIAVEEAEQGDQEAYDRRSRGSRTYNESCDGYCLLLPSCAQDSAA